MRLLSKRKIKANDSDKNMKIKMVNINLLKFDRDFKAVFKQETDKVTEIANDIKLNGFDKTRPIIVTDEYIIVDGHSRFMAAKKAELKQVPVIIKKFDSRDATIEYEYKMQLNSRRLSDGEYFDAFIRLDEFRKSDPNATGKTDESIAKQLNKSARQVSKMREIAKKASPELLVKIKNNSISLNKAYELIKSGEKETASATSDKTNQTGKGINSDSFKLGVLFVLSELEKGKKKTQILKDKRIAKLGIEEVKLSEDEINKISERFGII